MERIHGVMKTIILLAALGQFTDPGPIQTGGTGTTHPRAPITAEGGQSSAPLIATALPRVWMVTSANCPPCAAADAWIAQNGFPFAVTKTNPQNGQSTPTWVFQGHDGKYWQVVGWRGRETVEQLVAAYRDKNPVSEPVAAPRRAPEAETTVDTIRRFAGRGGRFTFVPDQPQNAQVTDGVTLQVGEIKGRYDLSGPEPRITFDQPTPRGTVEKFGFGIGYRVEGATWSPPKNEVKIATNWKTIRVSLE
jgi:hypothetical protein